MNLDLSPEKLLAAYAVGIFPMADDDGEMHWLAPDPRAILPLEGLVVSRSLRAVVQRGDFDVRFDADFAGVMRCCADRNEGTWISQDILTAYQQLHALGFAHSVEAWQDGCLVGGLYGVVIGGGFFGESMFYKVSNASKVALVHLVQHLQQRNFVLLDIQFMTAHLHSLGAVEIPREQYLHRLRQAIKLPCHFVDGSTTHG